MNLRQLIIAHDNECNKGWSKGNPNKAIVLVIFFTKPFDCAGQFCKYNLRLNGLWPITFFNWIKQINLKGQIEMKKV